jgi:hypothetical protein
MFGHSNLLLVKKAPSNVKLIENMVGKWSRSGMLGWQQNKKTGIKYRFFFKNVMF